MKMEEEGKSQKDAKRRWTSVEEEEEEVVKGRRKGVDEKRTRCPVLRSGCLQARLWKWGQNPSASTEFKDREYLAAPRDAAILHPVLAVEEGFPVFLQLAKSVRYISSFIKDTKSYPSVAEWVHRQVPWGRVDSASGAYILEPVTLPRRSYKISVIKHPSIICTEGSGRTTKEYPKG